MVARLGVDNKSQFSPQTTEPDLPPPPYTKSGGGGSPVLLATTTTTEVVTTTRTTTHFFSLPLWRRRGQTASHSLRFIGSATRQEENGMVSSERIHNSMRFEKDLPPLPIPEQESVQSSNGVLEDGETPGAAQMAHVNGDEPLSIALSHQTLIASQAVPPSSIPGFAHPSTQSTNSLAHTALGLGLIIPHASVFSASDVNNVAFNASPSTRPSEPPQPSPRVQRSRSFKFRQKERSYAEPAHPQDGIISQKRSISLSVQGQGGLASNGKGKEKETDAGDVLTESPSRTLSRRPSFWARRKKAESPAEIPNIPASQYAVNPDQVPSLPSMQPFAPIELDAPSFPSSSQIEHHTTRSPRSLSDHKSSHSLLHDTSLDASHEIISPNRTHIDQSTAHTAVKVASTNHVRHRPTTADTSRSRARSAFIEATRFPTTSPLKNPSPSSQELPQQSNPPLKKRQRAQTNPPLLQRLSVNLFASSPSSSTDTCNTSDQFITAPSTSTPSRSSLNKQLTKVTKPMADEKSPEVYLKRVLSAVSKSEVAAVLASSADLISVQALRMYIKRFDFRSDPLDIALRKLLMDVGLPRETQQIDRVIEAFANRYLQCNPSLFASEDQPYILAFSLIMLHTDAFNKSNKRKMSKPDYIKNTRLPGVAPEILDCFYDNIVFAPFIFIEDPLDANSQLGLTTESATMMLSAVGNHPAGGMNTTGLLGKSSKVDPYYLISHNLLGPLRVNVEAYVTLDDPYSYAGTCGSWDEEELQRVFANATVIELGNLDNSRLSSSIFSTGITVPMVHADASPDSTSRSNDIWSLKMAKVGVVNRKDDLLEGGKKATNRKWKQWSMILTGSQLLLFREATWVNTLLAHSDSSNGEIIFPQASVFKPDELLSIKDAIAVFDKSYRKYPNTLRFVMPSGRQFLLQASDETELNDWISLINYASAFRTAGVRMRPIGMSSRDMQMTGVAAATAHLHDMQMTSNQSNSPDFRSWDKEDMLEELLVESPISLVTKKLTIPGDRSKVDSDVPFADDAHGVDRIKATFDQVKAELAACHWASSDESSSNSAEMSNSCGGESFTTSFSSPNRSAPLRPALRSEIIRSKIRDFDSRITAAKAQLDSDMRFLRNVATMTPFQRATRDRLQLAVQNVAKRIMQVRLDLAKCLCYRDILSDDLASEGRDWHRAKKMALRAATETIQNRRITSIPKMTLSFHDHDEKTSSPRAEHHNGDQPSRPASSLCDSFHSALEFGPEWSRPSDEILSGYSTTSHIFDSPVASSSVGSFPFESQPAINTRPISSECETSSPLTRIGTGINGAENHGIASEEQAEDWNKTRCAQRVSLVRMPSDMRLSTFFGHQPLYKIGDAREAVEDSIVTGPG